MCDWLFKVTCNNISIIYVTAHRYAGGLKKLDLPLGSQATDILQDSLTCPSKHRHGTHLFTVIPTNRPISVAFYDAQGDRRTYSLLKPPGSPWGGEGGPSFVEFHSAVSDEKSEARAAILFF